MGPHRSVYLGALFEIVTLMVVCMLDAWVGSFLCVGGGPGGWWIALYFILRLPPPLCRVEYVPGSSHGTARVYVFMCS